MPQLAARSVADSFSHEHEPTAAVPAVNSAEPPAKPAFMHQRQTALQPAQTSQHPSMVPWSDAATQAHAPDGVPPPADATPPEAAGPAFTQGAPADAEQLLLPEPEHAGSWPPSQPALPAALIEDQTSPQPELTKASQQALAQPVPLPAPAPALQQQSSLHGGSALMQQQQQQQPPLQHTNTVNIWLDVGDTVRQCCSCRQQSIRTSSQCDQEQRQHCKRSHSRQAGTQQLLQSALPGAGHATEQQVQLLRQAVLPPPSDHQSPGGTARQQESVRLWTLLSPHDQQVTQGILADGALELFLTVLSSPIEHGSRWQSVVGSYTAHPAGLAEFGATCPGVPGGRAGCGP
jgi:hypothetical protein